MTQQRIGLAALSALDAQAFSARLGHVFEHSAWVADHAWRARPFAGVDALHAAMVQAVRDAGTDALVALLRLHPELAAPGRLTPASEGEQAGVGLAGLDSMRADAFADANRLYRERFGFPFIVAVRGQRDPSAILAAMQRRLGNTPAQELETAFEEVARIARYRLEDIVEPYAVASEAADFLTVHVLDVARGNPGGGRGADLEPRRAATLPTHHECRRPLRCTAAGGRGPAARHLRDRFRHRRLARRAV